jgi:SSS family solute:Na+ symporter
VFFLIFLSLNTKTNQMDFSTVDIAVFALYALIILSIGLYVSRQKKGESKSAEDYFLAGKSLP